MDKAQTIAKLERDELYKMLRAGTANANEQHNAAGWIRRLMIRNADLNAAASDKGIVVAGEH